MDRAIETLRQLPLGTRVVVRYRIAGGAPGQVPGTSDESAIGSLGPTRSSEGSGPTASNQGSGPTGRAEGSGPTASTQASGVPTESPRPERQPRLTDVLGFLTAVDEQTCTVQTKSGDVVVILASVQTAKAVPPAPERRVRRAPEH
ncbi:MAG TPA: hypothetical protein VLI70_03740 [Micrococcaceae bacterium]|nr:hypothetical protein [Micrococcaceae bacterium]